MGVRYLFLRTSVALNHAPEALQSLAALGDHSPERLVLGRPWEDGLLIRFESRHSVAKLASLFAPELRLFESWALHDGVSRCVDEPRGGAADLAFSDADGRLGSRARSQLIVTYDKANGRDSTRIEGMRSALEKCGACRPIFHARNGIALLITSSELTNITWRRCQGFLKDTVPWVFIDQWGATFDVKGSAENTAWSDAAESSQPRRANATW